MFLEGGNGLEMLWFYGGILQIPFLLIEEWLCLDSLIVG